MYTHKSSNYNETKRSENERKQENGHSHAAAPTLNVKHFNYVMIIFQYIFFLHIKEKPHHETLLYRYQSGTSAAHFFSAVFFFVAGVQKGKNMHK